MNKRLNFIVVTISILVFLSCDEDIKLPNVIDPVIVPQVNLDDIFITEGDDLTDVAIPIFISIPQDTAITVAYQTVDGTAINGEDYVANTGSISIPTQTQYKDILIGIIGDIIQEEQEQFSIIFSTKLGSNSMLDTIVVTIEDDDTHIFNYAGYTTPLEYDEYNLVWSDEFVGNELNSDNWVHEIGTGCPNICGWGNNELEYYRSENTFVANDLLTITAKREVFENSEFTSSRLKSQGKQNFKFGRLDIRARLPFGQGLWPALWMLGSNISQIGWPACGEIDIMELKGDKPDEMSCTLHYKHANGSHQFPAPSFSKLFGTDYSEEFHVFSIIWDIDKIKWYRDDILIKTVTHSALNVSTEGNPFTKEFFLLLNVAVGGNFLPNPTDATPFPQTMEVDYIRVFQRN